MLRPAAESSPAIVITVVAVLGWIVKLPVPVIFAPIAIASVVTVRLLAPIVIVPAGPVLNEAAVIVVFPRTLIPPTAPLKATVELPGLIDTVRAELLSKLLTLPLKVIG